MRPEKLLDAIGEIDDRKIMDAHAPRPSGSMWSRRVAVVACLSAFFVLLTLSFVIASQQRSDPPPTPPVLPDATTLTSSNTTDESPDSSNSTPLHTAPDTSEDSTYGQLTEPSDETTSPPETTPPETISPETTPPETTPPETTPPETTPSEQALFSAYEIYDIFFADNNDSSGGASTNLYTDVTQRSEYFSSLSALPTYHTMPLYQMAYPSNYDDSALLAYAEKYEPALKNVLNTDEFPDWYLYSDQPELSTPYAGLISTIHTNNHATWSVHISTYPTYHRLTIEQYQYQPLLVNGKTLTIRYSDNDEEIMDALQDTFSYLADQFGITLSEEYSHQNIRRSLLGSGATIYVSGFSVPESNPADLSHLFSYYPSFTGNKIYQPYIELSFSTQEPRDSDPVLQLRNIYINFPTRPLEETYTVTAQANLISLEKAEEYMHKGYIFAGHVCGFCISMNPEVDFSDYDIVTIEYIFDEDTGIGAPFYAFYKYRHTEDDQDTYAKIYIPAIEVSDMDQFFEDRQQKYHPTADLQ